MNDQHNLNTENEISKMYANKTIADIVSAHGNDTKILFHYK